jgi:hypothetical protein
MENKHSNTSSQGCFNTLVQKRTAIQVNAGQKTLTITGRGTVIAEKVMIGRARRKLITGTLMMELIKIAKRKNKLDMEQAYRDTYYCQSNIIRSDGNIHADFCKNHHCALCNSIKKALIINKYLPVIKQWSEPYVLVLTTQSCPAGQLSQRVCEMIKKFQLIKNKFQKREKRRRGKRLVGIKSLECNFNPIERTYNPHFHFIIHDKETAEILTEEWKLIWRQKGKGYVSGKGQYLKKVDDIEKELKEAIKYASKVFTDPTMEKKNKKQSERKIKPATHFIYLSAMDNIFTLFRNKRTFDRFGFNLPKHDKKEIIRKEIANDDELIFDFNFGLGDWINKKTKQSLSGYKPEIELTAILAANIDTTRE